MTRPKGRGGIARPAIVLKLRLFAFVNELSRIAQNAHSRQCDVRPTRRASIGRAYTDMPRSATTETKIPALACLSDCTGQQGGCAAAV
jgi:hypothetical protein